MVRECRRNYFPCFVLSLSPHHLFWYAVSTTGLHGSSVAGCSSWAKAGNTSGEHCHVFLLCVELFAISLPISTAAAASSFVGRAKPHFKLYSDCASPMWVHGVRTRVYLRTLVNVTFSRKILRQRNDDECKISHNIFLNFFFSKYGGVIEKGTHKSQPSHEAPSPFSGPVGCYRPTVYTQPWGGGCAVRGTLICINEWNSADVGADQFLMLRLLLLYCGVVALTKG